MTLLTQQLVGRLLLLPSSEKESAGRRIVEALGGDVRKVARGLPPRRGNQDGGIDGRLQVYRTVQLARRMERGDGQFVDVGMPEQSREVVTAGVTVKLERARFSRERLGGFVLDLEREQLTDGLIITASGLSPDAETVVDEIYATRTLRLLAITLAELLTGTIPTSPIEFVDDPRLQLLDHLRTLEA